MKAVTFKEQNIVFAENQKEYESLPAHIDQKSGLVTFCMELGPEEVSECVKRGFVSLDRLTFGGPVQPMRVDFTKPKFPVGFEELSSKVRYWSGNEIATLHFEIPGDVEKLFKRKKRIWVSTATFWSPLQPVGMDLAD